MELSFSSIYNNVSLINSATTPEIRLLQVALRDADAPLPVGSPVPTSTLSGWTLASPHTVRSFSAICYLTAREISERVKCKSGLPCHFGLIETCEGATDIQSWMSAEAREQARTSCWAMPGQPPPAALPPIVIGKHGGPSQLYNAMIAPLAGYTLAAILWDQGEDNVPYCSTHQYDCLYKTMMTDWRAKWKQSASSLPVTSVQLGGFIRESKVANIRLAQSDSLPAALGFWSNHSTTRIALPNSALAASYDLCSPQPGTEATPGRPGYSCWVHAWVLHLTQTLAIDCTSHSYAYSGHNFVFRINTTSGKRHSRAHRLCRGVGLVSCGLARTKHDVVQTYVMSQYDDGDVMSSTGGGPLAGACAQQVRGVSARGTATLAADGPAAAPSAVACARGPGFVLVLH